MDHFNEIGARLRRAGCDPALVKESFIRSQGAGGQNVNKVSTCVCLHYPPRGVTIKMQRHRTQAANRVAAWTLLAERLEQQRQEAFARRLAEAEKKKRAKRPRPAWLKREMTAMKRARSEKKRDRRARGDD